MNKDPGASKLDDAVPEDQYTDTSMFDAEEIVRNVEEGARRVRAEQQEQKNIDARRRAEIRLEQKRLEEDLKDIDGFEVEEWDGEE